MPKKTKSQNPDNLIAANGICSPKANGNLKRFGSCIPPQDMKTIANAYNKTASDKIPIQHMLDQQTLKNTLNRRLGCNGEKCWLQSPAIQNVQGLYDKLIKLYRPDMPKSWLTNPTEWLSNVDIEKVMKQYEENHPKFKFLGVFSIDFYSDEVCKHYSICNFNVFDFLATGKKEFGIVLNLDTYHGSGSHWVSIFACFNPKDPKFGLCYYDSGARGPPSHAVHFLKQVKKDARLFFKDQINDFDKRFKTQTNAKEHQKKNTECGVFSMIFLIMCLENRDKNYDSICDMLHVGSDDFINRFRRKLYHSL